MTPIAYWSGSGNALDPFGGANGTLYGGVTYGEGPVGQGFLFNGTNGQVFIPDDPQFQLTTSLSITAWVDPASGAPPGVDGNIVYIFFRGDDRVGYDPYYLGLTVDNRINFNVTDGSGDSYSISAPIPIGSPSFVTATLDDATGEMRLSLGDFTVADGFTTIRPFGALDADQSPGLAIGNTEDPGTFDQPFNGVVENLALYNVVVPNIYPLQQGVWGWGSDAQQQLGPQTSIPNPSIIPTLTAFPTDIVALAAGFDFNNLLLNDGSVWSVGTDTNGQLGDGVTGGNSSAPQQAQGLDHVVALAQSSGANHSLVLRSDGTVWTWGMNTNGQLGNDTEDDSNTPLEVWDPSGSGYLAHVVAVARGVSHSIALKSDGTVWAWGRNQDGQVGLPGAASAVPLPNWVAGLPRSIVAVAAGDSHCLALAWDGTVWAWGNDAEGELGNGTIVPANTSTPTPSQVSGLTNVKAIACGGFHCMALKSDGTVWTWGYDYYGQLGDGGTTNQALPVQTIGLPPIVSINAGTYFSVAVDVHGNVWTWGENHSAQEGTGSDGGQSSVPVMTSTLTGVSGISAGAAHNIALISGSPSCSGGVTLSSIDSGAPPQLVIFTFTPRAGGNSFTRGADISPDGSFTLPGVPSGTYNVSVAAEKYLRADIIVTVGSSPVTGIAVTLIPGDMNGDNVIDISDFSILASAFGSSIGDPTWNPIADLNSDGVIDLNDFSILADNFGLAGDP